MSVVPRRWRPLGRSMAHNRWPCRPRVGPLVCLTRAVRNRRNLETCFHYINPSFSSRKIRRTPFILTDKLPPLILLSRWCISVTFSNYLERTAGNMLAKKFDAEFESAFDRKAVFELVGSVREIAHFCRQLKRMSMTFIWQMERHQLAQKVLHCWT